LFAGAVKLTIALPLPGVAVPTEGAPGTVSCDVGVTAFDEADEFPEPALFVADTLNV
jgi:hypothetical protein